MRPWNAPCIDLALDWRCMALREKHAWRRRLGLRGSLWYFEEPKKPKPPSVFNQPAAWSAIVTAISAVLTAIFAYNNYLFTKQSYLQTHPPKLVAVSAEIDHGGGGWTYIVIVGMTVIVKR
jgi:uncharacterized membrane protein